MRYSTFKIIMAALILQVLACSSILAKDYMKVKLKNGYVSIIPLEDIKTITFVDLATALPKQRAIVAAAIMQFKVYPNPAKELVNIEYDLPMGSEVVLQIFSFNGQLVYTFNAGYQEAGNYTHQWSTQQAGIYVCKITQNNEVVTKKILIK